MIDLETAYVIRAEARAFIANYGGSVLNEHNVEAEIRRLHPDLGAEDAVYLARRTLEFMDMDVSGLDYYEAPERADGAPEWYPVRRDGRLQRVSPEEITSAEIAEVVAGEDWQLEEMQAKSAETAEEFKLLCKAGMCADPPMKTDQAVKVLEAMEADLSASERAVLRRLRTKAKV